MSRKINIDDKINYIALFLKNTKYSPDYFIKYLAKVSYENNIYFKHPLMITWDLTNYCNLDCSFCSASASKIKSIHNFDWKKYIEFIDSCNPLYLTLRGGEPSIHPRFNDILESLKGKRYFIEIVTNGTGITEKTISILEKFDQDLFRIKISLDSDNEKINDSNRSKRSFFFAVRALSLLTKSKVKNVRVQCVATETTAKRVYDLYNFLHQFNVNSFGISYVLPTGKGFGLNTQVLNEKLFDEFIKCIKKFKRNKKINLEKNHLGYWQTRNINNSISKYDSNENFHIKCGAGKWKLNIDSNGDIYPCDFLKYQEFKIGTINDSSDLIWKSDIISKLRYINRNDKKECSECRNKTCNTGCMGLAFEKYGSILRKDPNCLYEDL